MSSIVSAITNVSFGVAASTAENEVAIAVTIVAASATFLQILIVVPLPPTPWACDLLTFANVGPACRVVWRQAAGVSGRPVAKASREVPKDENAVAKETRDKQANAMWGGRFSASPSALME